MSTDTCQYKRCGHPLGPWVKDPEGIQVDGIGDIEVRTCEKCGGQQTRGIFTDPKEIEALESIFDASETE